MKRDHKRFVDEVLFLTVRFRCCSSVEGALMRRQHEPVVTVHTELIIRLWLVQILGRWGHDGKKELEFDSLKAWLTSVNKGVEPSDDETKWVMAMANQVTLSVRITQPGLPAEKFCALPSWLLNM
eukprot:1048901-Rhodomonas_salina.1